MKKASQDYSKRYSQVGWQFCLAESVNFSDPVDTLKNDAHSSKMYITVHWKVLLRNIDDPELTKCFLLKDNLQPEEFVIH